MRALIIGPKNKNTHYYRKREPHLFWNKSMASCIGQVIELRPDKTLPVCYTDRKTPWVWHEDWIKIL